MTAISNQIKAPLERPWNSRAIRDEIAAIVEACGDRRRMQDPETLLPLRNRCERNGWLQGWQFLDSSLPSDLAKGSKTLGRHLREDPAAPHGPSELADYCVRPLLGLLITKLVDLGFAPLEQETAQILQGLTRFVESHFTVDIAVEDPQQLHIAQSILKDERDRLLHQLRRKRSKVLKEKRASACAGLRQVLESAMNDVLGPMFMSARALKAARGMTVNVRRLDDVERMTKQVRGE